MPAYFDRGIMNQSSWHGLEEVGVLLDAEDMIRKGQETGAWPIDIEFIKNPELSAIPGVHIPGRAVVAHYRKHPSRGLAMVGGRFTHTTPEKWGELIKAAVKAGAKPTGAFSLKMGRRILATFEVGEVNGLKTYLVMVDGFDGSIKLLIGFTTIRVVCANTLQAFRSQDGEAAATLRHNSTLPEKIEVIREVLDDGIQANRSFAELYQEAVDTRLDRDSAQELLYTLYPDSETDDKGAQTRAENKRLEVLKAAHLPVNRVGSSGCPANLWNAATWVLDRDLDGKYKKTRGLSALDSMLMGPRSKEVAKIEMVMVELLRPDGSVEAVPVEQAAREGVGADQIGSAALRAMLDEEE